MIENVLKPLAKSVLISLGLITTASAIDAATHKKNVGVRCYNINLERRNYIMKIVKSLEGSGLLIKGVSETIKNKSKAQKGGFLSILLGTLKANLLGKLLTGKDTIISNDVTIRAGQDY